MKKPELLAPVGSKEALVAAINAGCDAVYLSGYSFGARAFAPNFDLNELKEAIDLWIILVFFIKIMWMRLLFKI